MKQFVACREILGDEKFGDEVWVNLDYVQAVYPYTSCLCLENLRRDSFGDVVEDCDGVQYVCSKYDEYCECVDNVFNLCILTFGDEI